ncbi:MAG TPA: hypothetical protein VFM05_13520 [Candidatus Saccharimonadales bacterium]|nr:hypothetical protein [Candidatus Saccharimonadales bacterium]
MARATCLLFAGTDFLTVWIITPKENTVTTQEQTKILPGVLMKNDQRSGLVAARYRLSNERNMPASAAHRAKNMTSRPLIVVLFCMRHKTACGQGSPCLNGPRKLMSGR